MPAGAHINCRLTLVMQAPKDFTYKINCQQAAGARHSCQDSPLVAGDISRSRSRAAISGMSQRLMQLSLRRRTRATVVTAEVRSTKTASGTSRLATDPCLQASFMEGLLRMAVWRQTNDASTFGSLARSSTACSAFRQLSVGSGRFYDRDASGRTPLYTTRRCGTFN